jgi:hypothetical protein
MCKRERGDLWRFGIILFYLYFGWL